MSLAALAGEIGMNEDQIRAVAAEAAKEAVLDVLTRLGVSADKPLEMQQDMQYLRSWRLTSEQIKGKGLTVMVGIILSGLLGALFIGFKSMFR